MVDADWDEHDDGEPASLGWLKLITARLEERAAVMQTTDDKDLNNELRRWNLWICPKINDMWRGYEVDGLQCWVPDLLERSGLGVH